MGPKLTDLATLRSRTRQEKKMETSGEVLSAFRATVLIAGGTNKNDASSPAEKTEKDRPGIAGTKAIAEEGFLYGLPIVMNYDVMHE
jgi:hypothetical protein